MKTIFIETSALVDYAIKSRGKGDIARILSEYDTKVSSNYVRMELLRGVIQYLTYLHNKIANCSTWSDVQNAISNLSSTPQRHRLGAVLEAMTEFWGSIQDKAIEEIAEESPATTLGDYVKKRSMPFIWLQIRRLWRTFDKIVEESSNPMDCYVDLREPTRNNNGLVDNSSNNCGKSETECQIRQFFEENKAQFESVYNCLKDLPEAEVDQKHRNSLKEILRLLPYKNRKISNREDKMKKHCWNCGDSILSVLAPKDATILHHNAKHYEPICRAINRESKTY